MGPLDYIHAVEEGFSRLASSQTHLMAPFVTGWCTKCGGCFAWARGDLQCGEGGAGKLDLSWGWWCWGAG